LGVKMLWFAAHFFRPKGPNDFVCLGEASVFLSAREVASLLERGIVQRGADGALVHGGDLNWGGGGAVEPIDAFLRRVTLKDLTELARRHRRAFWYVRVRIAYLARLKRDFDRRSRNIS
jgi:hypothetical protein